VKARARGHFSRGVQLYEDSDYGLALIEFERAYALVADYRVLYNIGQVAIQLGRYARATRAFEQYLKEGGTTVPPERVTEVNKDLEMLRTRTAFLQVTSNVPGAEVLLDDVHVADTPLREPLLVDAGEHRLVVRKPGFTSKPKQLALAGGDTVTMDVALTEERLASSPERTVIVQQDRTTPAVVRDDDRSTWLWAGWTTTGAAAIGATVTGLLGMSAASDLEQQRKPATSTAEDREDTKSRAQGLFLASDILTGTAIVAGGVSLYFTLKGPSEPAREKAASSTTVRAVVRPGGVGLVGTF
jgi:hypothetical protein